MRRPHTDRFAKTAVRILRLSASPTHFLDNNFPLQSRPPVKVALLGNCFCPSGTHAESRSRFGPFGLPCFLFEPLLPTASPVSDSPLLALYLQTRFGPFHLHRYLVRNAGMSLVSTSKTSGLAMDAPARVASYLDPA